MAAQTQAAGIAASGFGTLGLQSCISSGLSRQSKPKLIAQVYTEATRLRMNGLT